MKKVTKSPLEDLDFLATLVVGIGEVAEITGVPARQIRYWEEKNIIKACTHAEAKNRRYDYLNIKKILLIKELLEEGFTLDAAASKLEKRLSSLNSVFASFKKSR
mgnify:CR=1 FL=1|jgi:DNA-binding transcriptional MerR regulator